MKLLSTALIGFTLTLLTTTASAAIVSLDGLDVRFTYDDSTLYGTGIVVGNSIVFTPADFIAQSLNGDNGNPLIITASETLNLQVEVINPATSLLGFQLLEQGDYFLNGPSATAQAAGIFEVSSNTSAYAETKSFDAGPLNTINLLTNWDTSSAIDLSDTAGWYTDTDVAINITNILTATTIALGDQSLVQKKFAGVGLEVTLVPVPGALWLFGSALLGLGAIKRRK